MTWWPWARFSTTWIASNSISNELPRLPVVYAHLVEYGLIHITLGSLASDLSSYTDKVLFQRYRTERGIEEEQTLISVDSVISMVNVPGSA